jgi:GNAT superfamily N-acetyltransferase
MPNGYTAISTLSDAQVRDLHELYRYEWWSGGRDLPAIQVALRHSDFLFGFVAASDERLVAFARVLTDRIFKATIFDVIVARDHRGRGLGRALIERVLAHPDLAAVRHVELYCRPELMPLYEQFGFTAVPADVCLMRRASPA